MTILHYHCFAGMSGDMNLAAMIDLGVDADYLRAELAKLKLHGYELKTERADKNGIFGTRVNVKLKHEHHHQHHLLLMQQPQHHHHEPHRTFRDIETLINNSSLAVQVKALSIKIFEVLARAEAKIHNKTIDEIHFHEVGSTDSIVDIVGAAICFDYLKPDKVLCSPVEVGGGMVKCAHGLFPVPAPATAEILSGVPTTSGRVQHEATTPTGAAILKVLVNEFTDSLNIITTKTAYGIGHRDAAVPNVVRLSIGQSNEPAGSQNTVIECNVDDMTAEDIAYAIDKILEAGALDAFVTPVIMKKGRPGHLLSVICMPDSYDHIAETIFAETNTIGLRSYAVHKQMLPRQTVTVNTAYGEVRFKISGTNPAQQKAKPEFDDLAQIAKKHNMPIRRVREIAQAAFRRENP